jgi:hypothetical protein
MPSRQFFTQFHAIRTDRMTADRAGTFRPLADPVAAEFPIFPDYIPLHCVVWPISRRESMAAGARSMNGRAYRNRVLPATVAATM